MLMSSNRKRYHIVRRVGHQGTRHSVTSQTEVAKYATGCDGLSPSSIIPGTRNQILTVNNNKNKKNGNNSNSDNSNRKKHNINKIRISTVNVRTLQDDMKLATAIKSVEHLGMDILAMQEVRRNSTGIFQLIWSGHKLKKEHGVGILLAPMLNLSPKAKRLN